MSKKKINTDKRLPFDRRMKHLETVVVVTTEQEMFKSLKIETSKITFRKKERIDEWLHELSADKKNITNMTYLR
ncbi:MAG: hypothetical protein ABF690_13180 [Liquorilactobacillus nagelii]|uniref:hypothetical protein n=1 Tax=Lactobacillaceae TaxID=33958 RepID=UPI0039ED71C9